jgi:ribosomal protein L17
LLENRFQFKRYIEKLIANAHQGDAESRRKS